MGRWRRPRPLELYHERTRRRGVNSVVYWSIRFFAKPALLVYFRLARRGHGLIPDGGVILASNHRSFLDPFVLGTCVPRPIYFMAKQEIFRNPFVGWLLNCLGAFPLRRGASDEESMKTALALLERGEVVVIFPEGTRIRRGSLGRPRRGVGRLGARERRPRGAGRGDRQRARPARLAHQAGEGAPALRRAAHLPARGQPVALPRRRGDRADLAVRGAPVGVARRAAAAAHRGRGGRRDRWAPPRPWCSRARDWRCSSAAARASRRSASRPRARTPPTCRASSSTARSSRARARRGVRRRGPGGAGRALQRAARRRRRDRRSRGRAQRRARGLQGARAAARHHALGLRGRAREGARGGVAGRSRPRARGDRAGRVRGAGHPQRGPAAPAGRGA